MADLSVVVKLTPKLAFVYAARGNAYRRNKDYAGALQDLDQAIRLDKTWWGAYYQSAWIRTTCPDPAFRDGKKAIVLATQACEIIAWKAPCRVTMPRRRLHRNRYLRGSRQMAREGDRPGSDRRSSPVEISRTPRSIREEIALSRPNQ